MTPARAGTTPPCAENVNTSRDDPRSRGDDVDYTPAPYLLPG